jgi:hypothetical protein
MFYFKLWNFINIDFISGNKNVLETFEITSATLHDHSYINIIKNVNNGRMWQLLDR